MLSKASFCFFVGGFSSASMRPSRAHCFYQPPSLLGNLNRQRLSVIYFFDSPLQVSCLKGDAFPLRTLALSQTAYIKQRLFSGVFLNKKVYKMWFLSLLLFFSTLFILSISIDNFFWQCFAVLTKNTPPPFDKHPEGVTTVKFNDLTYGLLCGFHRWFRKVTPQVNHKPSHLSSPSCT